MANKKYDGIIDNIIDMVGGKDNISYFSHCVTRLRFNVKDKGLVGEAAIDELPAVVGHQWSGEQLQVIVGPAVGEVFKAISSKYGYAQEENTSTDSGEKKKFSLMAIADVISSCITPVLPVMIGGGMLKVILLIATMTGLLTTESASYVTLGFVSDAAFYFLPVFVGAAAARKFGMNMWIGMFLGAVLISPTLTQMIADGSGGSVFGIPIFAANYASSIFPIILSVWIGSYVEKFANRYSPDFLKTMLVPLVTILVMTPVMLTALAPMGAVIGNYLTAGVTWMYDKTGFMGLAILGMLQPWMVITGMHHSFNPYIFQSFAQLGYEPLALVVTFVNNLNQGIAAMAVGLKTKNKDLKSTATTTGATALIVGVTEPVLYGVNLKYRTPLYAIMIGNFVGGAIAGLFKVVIYAFAGSWGVFGLPAFIGANPKNNFLHMIIAVVVGMIVTFIATLVLYKDDETVSE